MIIPLPPLDKDELKISFVVQDIDFSLTHHKALGNWILKIVASEEKNLHQLQYFFVSDEYLLELNREHLDHDYYTDIITFPLNEDPIVADIMISIDRVRDNASQLSVSFEEELHRVMIHGVLHMCGYGDKTEAEAMIMRQKESDALILLSGG